LKSATAASALAQNALRNAARDSGIFTGGEILLAQLIEHLAHYLIKLVPVDLRTASGRAILVTVKLLSDQTLAKLAAIPFGPSLQ